MSVGAHVERLQVGEWLAEPALDRISRNGEVVKLEPRTMRLLMRLCESPGHVMSARQLLDEVWSGVVVGPASLYQAISQLRKLLADTDPVPTYIATIPRKGYRLIAPVRRVESAHVDDALPVAASLPAPAGPVAGLAGEVVHEHTPLAAARPRRWIDLFRPVAAIVVAIVSIAWLGTLWNAQPASLAVLPFTDLSADHRNGAFCDGLTEELSTTLSQLPTLRVVARTSAFAFRGRNIDVREIGRKLGATHVLEGSVRRSGDAIRVTAQLIDARHGYQSWSQSYDLRSHDVLRLQSDIARAVAAQLAIRFPAASVRQAAARGSDDAAAYELHLIARHYFRERTPQANARAASLDARAIELDRSFAPAYVGLAAARLNELALAGRPIHELSGEVETLLNTALQLNPDLAEAYATRGALRRELNRFADAKKDLARAIALDRNNVQAFVNLGRVFEYEGQPRRALESFTQAQLLDPLDFMRQVDRCVALQDLGRYDEAAADCAEARRLQPRSEWGFMATSWIGRARGRQAQALYWNDEALRIAPRNVELYLERTDALLNLGMIEQAKQALQAAQSAAGDDAAIRIRYADIVMLESGADAVADYLAQLQPDFQDENATAIDLLTATQVGLTAGDYERARKLARRAAAAPDFSAVELGHRASIKWGVSYQLPLALLDLHEGRRSAARTRVTNLLRTIDELERNGYIGWGTHAARADALGLLGDADGAMRALRKAVQAGWRSSWAAQRDPYLAALFERADFRQLMRSVEQLNAAERARYEALRSAASLARGEVARVAAASGGCPDRSLEPRAAAWEEVGAALPCAAAFLRAP